ncbi:MAG: hypothetical protein U5R30_14975 [Deltaproteobacteria bacterium]|nr:hypothetical protein [Deltaproteobacteria bacterium]
MRRLIQFWKAQLPSCAPHTINQQNFLPYLASLVILSKLDSQRLAFGSLKKEIVMRTPPSTVAVRPPGSESTAFKVLGAIGFSHLLNDMIQSLLPAIYPLLKSSFSLTFTQIGLITLTFQITASLLQPMVGLYADPPPKTCFIVHWHGLTH